VLNALNGGVGRRGRFPLWVGAFAFVVVTAVVTIGVMSVAIGVLATLRVAYTTSIDRVSSVSSPTEQRLIDRQSPQTATPIPSVVLRNEMPTHAVAADHPGLTPAPVSASPAETTQPNSIAPVNLPPQDAARGRAVEALGSTMTGSIEGRVPTARSDGGGHAAETAAASPTAATAGPSAPPIQPPPSAGFAQRAEGAATAAAPETDEIGRLATEPLPVAMTAAALSHLRHALKRRAQVRVVKHAAHKPAPRPVPQDVNFRPFDPFQPVTQPPAASRQRAR
jgi:hypothetical protein